MAHLYFLLGLSALVLLFFVLSLRRRFSPRFRLPYLADEALFTASQRAFQAVLEEAVGPVYRVYGKVRAADVIGLRPRLTWRERERAEMRLAAYGFDFIVCRPESSAIACAIHLAPRSRLRSGVPKDQLDRICAAAGLPLARFREQDSYVLSAVQEQLATAMRVRPTRPERPATDEIAPDEAPPLHFDLSDAVSLDDAPERESRRPALASTPLSLSKLSSTRIRAPAPPPAPLPRLEPQILSHSEVEDGPRFKLGAKLDDI